MVFTLAIKVKRQIGIFISCVAWGILHSAVEFGEWGEKREKCATQRGNSILFLSLPFFPQLVVLHCKLLKKTKVGLDLSGQNTISIPLRKEG